MKKSNDSAASGFRSRLGAFLANEREVLFAFIGTRLLLWAITWLGFHLLKHGDYQIFPGTQPWNLLFHWDALWYARIVAHGYDYTPDAQSSVAFFPLLPLVIYGLRMITGLGTALAGFLITNTSLLGSAILLRRMVALDFPAPSRAPQRAVWLLLLCPMTFFYSAVYTESLFLALSIAAVFFARRRQFLLSGIFGALLTATRANAILILIPLLWEAFAGAKKSEGNDRDTLTIPNSRWWLILTPLGLVVYSAYLFTRFRDPFAFLHAQAAFHREFASAFEGLATAVRYPMPYGPFFIAAALTGVTLVVLGFTRKIRTSYQLFALSMLALCLSTSIWESVPRYLSAVFPFYVVLGSIRSKGVYGFVLAASAAIMAVCSTAFVCGYFMT